MTQTQFAAAAEDFSYGASQDAGARKLSVSIFADRAHVRDELREDAQAAGFHIAEATGLAALYDKDERPLGDVVLLDCPVADGAALAALARLDMRAARADAALVVSTNFATLNDVFGCLDQSNPQILVDPSRAERLIALGRVVAHLPGRAVRELTEEDRLVLLRLTEQVSQIAKRIGHSGGQGAEAASGRAGHRPHSADAAPPPPGSGSAFSFMPSVGLREAEDDAGDRLIREAAPALPEPGLVRRIIRQRQLRARFFDGDLFADPAWDMLLDLTAARAERSRVSVTSLCIASGVPPTTALRWIGQMTEAGLLQRNEDKTDRRRAFITLSDKAADAMTRFFAQLGDGATRMI